MPRVSHYICNVPGCGKELSNPSSLKRHMKLHSDEMLVNSLLLSRLLMLIVLYLGRIAARSQVALIKLAKKATSFDTSVLSELNSRS